MSLIFDIETVGDNFDELDEATKSNLTRWIKREAGDNNDRHNALLKDLKEGLGFSPLTGQIAVIGIFDSGRNQGVVYYQAPDANDKETREENFVFKPRTEKEMLANFWQGAKQYSEFVSFNGRSFDVPFLVTRSAVHKIKPTIDLMSNRYLSSQKANARHIDLLDQFSFYGALRRRGSLHLYCRAFSIKSPKASGITGDDVSRLFKEKKYKEIAEYNSWDLIATWELYKIWLEHFNI
jgi:3'-5' exonuclease